MLRRRGVRCGVRGGLLGLLLAILLPASPVLAKSDPVTTALVRLLAEKLSSGSITDRLKDIPVTAVAKNVAESTGRSLVLGPMLGAGATFGEVGPWSTAWSLGLGAQYFENRALSVEAMKERVIEVLERKVPERLKAYGVKLSVSPLEWQKLYSPQKLEVLANRLYDDLKDEVLRATRPQKEAFPVPSTGLLGELIWLPGRDSWQLRGSFGVLALGKVLLGPTATIHIGPQNSAAVGLEATVSMMQGQGTRTLLWQGYLRYDAYVWERAAFGHQAAVGLRLFFDLV